MPLRMLADSEPAPETRAAAAPSPHATALPLAWCGMSTPAPSATLPTGDSPAASPPALPCMPPALMDDLATRVLPPSRPPCSRVVPPVAASERDGAAGRWKEAKGLRLTVLDRSAHYGGDKTFSAPNSLKAACPAQSLGMG